MSLKITTANRIRFLEMQLHSEVIVNYSQYFNSSRPKNYDNFKAIPGYLKGINKNSSQQFDIDVNCGKDGLSYYNCFNDLCRVWSHTAHAENITVIKRPILSLTDQEAIRICREIGLVRAEVVERDNEIIFLIDDSYTVGFYADGTVVMYKDRPAARVTPYWNDIQALTDILRREQVAVPFLGIPVADLVKSGWIKF